MLAFWVFYGFFICLKCYNTGSYLIGQMKTSTFKPTRVNTTNTTKISISTSNANLTKLYDVDETITHEPCLFQQS